jgi:integral membrane sensor domain MASE1
LVVIFSGFTVETSLHGNVWPLARLAGVLLVVPLFTATAGAYLLYFYFGSNYLEAWQNWYFAQICGWLIIAPLVLSWT